MPDGGVERRADDQHVLVVALRPAANLLPQRPAADRLVRDHEDAVLVLAAAPGRDGLPRGLGAVCTHEVDDPGKREQDEDGEPRPLADRERRNRDRGEVTHRQEEEAIRLSLTAKRVDHR